MLRPWKLDIRLDLKNEKAIYVQIADAIISDIQSGRLKTGDALPGSRLLAEMLKVNRNTVVEALNLLLNEEWIVSRERKGTFVADILPGNWASGKKTPRPPKETPPQKYRISFDDGHPDSKIAPVLPLARAYRQIFNRNARWQMMGYSNELGDPDFINVIVRMLNQQRGMQINNQSVCITRGSQMAMYLAAQCLLSKGDFVMVENPGYKPAWKAFESAGAELLPVRVDQEGLVIDEVVKYLKQKKKIRAIYITPHHQYPTTVTLSLQRRLELIQLANQHGFTIIEDDYDNEFHYGYRPLLPLSSFPELSNYVYIGTMSKIVAPALRIGYLVCSNPELLKKVGELRRIIDVQGDGIMERAVLQLINDGTIKRHVRKATNHYRAKRDFVDNLLAKHLAGRAHYRLPDGGLAFWIEPRVKVNWPKVSTELMAKGIKILTPDYYCDFNSINGLRFGFGSLSEKDLTEAIKALATHLPVAQ